MAFVYTFLVKEKCCSLVSFVKCFNWM